MMAYVIKTYLNRGRSMRNVAKVRADDRAAMAAQRAIHKEANHCSSSEKNGLEQGRRQLGMPPTLKLELRL